MSDKLSDRPPSLMALPSYLASMAAAHGRRLLEEALTERGMVLRHNAIIAALHDLGPLSQQEVARILRIDKSHLVSQIDHLEQRGVLTRSVDPADRRRYRLELTPDGTDLAEELDEIGRRSQERFLDCLSPDERTHLVDMLRRVLIDNDRRVEGR